MKDFLKLFCKITAVLLSFSVIFSMLWNKVIVPDLGIGTKAGCDTFFVILSTLCTLSFIRHGLSVVDFIKYTTTWVSIIFSFLCALLILLIYG